MLKLQAWPHGKVVGTIPTISSAKLYGHIANIPLVETCYEKKLLSYCKVKHREKCTASYYGKIGGAGGGSRHAPLGNELCAGRGVEH